VDQLWSNLSKASRDLESAFEGGLRTARNLPDTRDLKISKRLYYQTGVTTIFPTRVKPVSPPSYTSAPIRVTTMTSLRIARAAVRARPMVIGRAPAQVRTYADAVPDKIKLSLALPHQVRSGDAVDELCLHLHVVHLQIYRCVSSSIRIICGIN
jgi:hypothetical protein